MLAIQFKWFTRANFYIFSACLRIRNYLGLDFRWI